MKIKNFFFSAEKKNEIIKKLFEKTLPKPDNFADYVFPKASEEINIPDKYNLLIIDADEEDATLVIRKARKDLLQEQLTKEEVPSTNGISQKLVDMFKESGIENVNDTNYKMKDGKLEPRPKAITDNKLYRYYYIKEKAGKYSMDGDRIHNNLKVKKEEGKDGKTLKIYKKRGEYFKAAEDDGEAKIE